MTDRSLPDNNIPEHMPDDAVSASRDSVRDDRESDRSLSFDVDREVSSGSISLTPAAVAAVRAALAKRNTPDAALRLGVKPGGCNGYSYVISYDDDPARAHDATFVFDGIRVVVDGKSLVFLNGSVLDYEKTLMKQGFRFLNPNEASACGCGSSFSVK